MSRRILLVDDHDANRTILRRRLERRGYSVIEASDGEQAIAKFTTDWPDIVLMDLSMPTVSGFEALERIRKFAPARHAPILALTAHATEAVRQRCQQAGFDGFQTKPIDFQRLVQDIESLVTFK